MPTMPARPTLAATPAPATVAQRLSVGRSLVALSMLLAPVSGARLMGLDSATARRVAWLARMMAIRDGALGAGGLDALRRGNDVRPWVLGGAISDTVDALVIAGALRSGRLKGVRPTGVVLVTAGLAAVGAATAARA